MFTHNLYKRFLFSLPQRPQLYSLQLIRAMSIQDYFIVSVFYREDF
jgi:aspartyl-tRNA synthetase